MRNKKVMVRLTNQEHKELVRAAQSKGVGMATLMRAITLAHLRKATRNVLGAVVIALVPVWFVVN